MMSSMVNPVFFGGFCGGRGGGNSSFFMDKSLAMLFPPDGSMGILDGPGRLDMCVGGGGGKSGGFKLVEGGIRIVCGRNWGASCGGGGWMRRFIGGVCLPLVDGRG